MRWLSTACVLYAYTTHPCTAVSELIHENDLCYSSQGSVATFLWWYGQHYNFLMSSSLRILCTKKILKSVNNCRSYWQNFTATFFMAHSVCDSKTGLPTQEIISARFLEVKASEVARYPPHHHRWQWSAGDQCPAAVVLIDIIIAMTNCARQRLASCWTFSDIGYQKSSM